MVLSRFWLVIFISSLAFIVLGFFLGNSYSVDSVLNGKKDDPILISEKYLDQVPAFIRDSIQLKDDMTMIVNRDLSNRDTTYVYKNKTVKILNSLFDNDPNAKECIVMIENKSDCNIIVRMEGVGITKYRLPVPAHGDNSIVVQKGDYLFTSIVCGAQYASQKTIQKPLMVALGSSVKK